jgi:hypothetical protein
MAYSTVDSLSIMWLVGALKLGDYIILRTDTFDLSTGYLGSEGIIVDDLFLESDSKNISDCLFCVHPQRNYSAAKELQSFLDTLKINDNIEDENLLHYIKALQVTLSISVNN